MKFSKKIIVLTLLVFSVSQVHAWSWGSVARSLWGWARSHKVTTVAVLGIVGMATMGIVAAYVGRSRITVSQAESQQGIINYFLELRAELGDRDSDNKSIKITLAGLRCSWILLDMLNNSGQWGVRIEERSGGGKDYYLPINNLLQLIRDQQAANEPVLTSEVFFDLLHLFIAFANKEIALDRIDQRSLPDLVYIAQALGATKIPDKNFFPDRDLVVELEAAAVDPEQMSEEQPQ